MPTFPKCTSSWNARTKFHIDEAKKWQAKGTAKDCHRAEAHMDEARRTMSACQTPFNLQELWRATSRSVLATCARKRGPGLRGTRRRSRRKGKR